MSGATSRRKGKEAELKVTHALRDAGFEAQTSRAVLGGTQRGSDIVVDIPVAIEVKDRGAMDLSGWLAQAKADAGGRIPIVWHKRRGHSKAEDWYVTMDGAAVLRLLQLAFGERSM